VFYSSWHEFIKDYYTALIRPDNLAQYKIARGTSSLFGCVSLESSKKLRKVSKAFQLKAVPIKSVRNRGSCNSVAISTARMGSAPKEDWRTNERGQKLATIEYAAKSGKPVAVLVWHHGLGEHFGRYQRHCEYGYGSNAQLALKNALHPWTHSSRDLNVLLSSLVQRLLAMPVLAILSLF
jgi:hypothetical protein